MVEVLSERRCIDCHKAFKAEEHHQLCPDCVEERMADYDETCVEDEDEFDDYDCGLMRDGQCTKAGSEECDFSCPNRESELFAGSAAWIAKHSKKPRIVK